MASNTITSITRLVYSKAIAVKFEALGFFAITKHFFLTLHVIMSLYCFNTWSIIFDLSGFVDIEDQLITLLVWVLMGGCIVLSFTFKLGELNNLGI
jgi:hypothetical protein